MENWRVWSKKIANNKRTRASKPEKKLKEVDTTLLQSMMKGVRKKKSFGTCLLTLFFSVRRERFFKEEKAGFRIYQR